MKNLKLLSKIALSFQNLDDFDKRMNEILGDIGNFVDVSRIYIFLNESEEIVSNTFEWCGKGITPQKENLQKVNNKDMPSFDKILKRDGCICSSDINNLPEDIRENLKEQKIKSIVAYPLIIKKQMIGFIGFDECRYKREWNEDELEILKTISGLVSSAYENRFSRKNLIDSETNFRNFFETIDDMFIVTNLDQEIIHCNKSLIDKLEYSLLELKDMDILNLHPENKRLETSEKIETILKGEVDSCHLEVESKSGDTYLVDRRIWFGKWNKEDCIFSISKDITERLELRLSLEENYQKLSHIIDGTRLGTWELDIQTGDIECNDYWTTMSGYSLEELEPINMDRWTELTHPEDLAKSYKMLEKHFNGEAEYYESEMRMKHKDGSWKWFQARGKVTELDADGKALKMFGTHSDINLRKQAEKSLKESEKRFFLALDKAEAGLWDVDLINRSIFLSPMWKKILGYLDNEIENSLDTWEKFIHPDDKEEIKKLGKDFINGKSDTYESISRFKHKDGHWRWILIRGGVLNGENNRASRLIGTIMDVTLEQEQSLELERFFSVNLDLLCISDLEGNFIKTNKAWEDILGYSADKLKGRNFLEFIHPDDIQITSETIKKLSNNEKVTNFINRYINIDGDYRYIEWKANSYGSSIYSAARDVTDRIKYEEKILGISNRDSLTNAYNRRYIFSRLEEIIEEYRRTSKIFSICIIDIDDFKRINDNYGHQAGDYILKEFTRIIDENLRPYDLLGRYGGEEFIIFLNAVNGEDSKRVIDRILNLIREKIFYFNGNDISFTFSAGISTCTEVLEGEMIDTLINMADQRMYHAKNRGKNEVVFII